MAETFVITVLSFALVLAVVASLLIWVILPALKDDEEKKEEEEEITLSDYIDQINHLNHRALDKHNSQQDAIEDNAEEIQNLKNSMSGSGGAVSTSTEASASFGEDGIWTIDAGQFTFKATQTHMCDSNGENCVPSGSGTQA